MALAWFHRLDTKKKCPLDQVNSVRKVWYNSIKREQRYFEFKVDVYKQTYKQTDKQTDLVLEVTPPEVGHLKTDTQTKYCHIFKLFKGLGLSPELCQSN